MLTCTFTGLLLCFILQEMNKYCSAVSVIIVQIFSRLLCHLQGILDLCYVHETLEPTRDLSSALYSTYVFVQGSQHVCDRLKLNVTFFQRKIYF